MKNGEKRRYFEIIKDKPVKTAVFGICQRYTVMLYYTHNGRPLIFWYAVTIKTASAKAQKWRIL